MRTEIVFETIATCRGFKQLFSQHIVDADGFHVFSLYSKCSVSRIGINGCLLFIKFWHPVTIVDDGDEIIMPLRVSYAGMHWQGTMSVVQLNPSNTSSNENTGGSVAKVMTSVNPLQLQKASPPMLFKALPRVNVPVNPLQLRKALGSISVTELGMVKDPVNPKQPQNAEVPMEVTALLRFKLENPLHL